MIFQYLLILTLKCGTDVCARHAVSVFVVHASVLSYLTPSTSPGSTLPWFEHEGNYLRKEKAVMAHLKLHHLVHRSDIQIVHAISALPLKKQPQYSLR